MNKTYTHDWINHDVSHCLDYDANKCPGSCFRAQVTEDLNDRHDLVGIPMSWSHFRHTSECELNRTEQQYPVHQYTVKDFPPYLDYPKPRRKVTNGDKIRAMTDEELAKLLCDFIGCMDCPYLRKPEECDGKRIGWLDWLKQEVEE